MRRLPALLGLLLGIILLGLAFPASASALDVPLPDIPGVDVPGIGDCRTGAPIGSPDAGVAASIDPGPAAPSTGDPLKPGGPSLYDSFGYGGAVWFDLDPTCFDKVNPVDRNGTVGTLASIGLSVLTWAVALVVLVLRLAFSPQALHAFDSLQTQAASGLGRLFAWGFILTASVTIILLTRHAAKAKTAKVAGGIGTIVMIGALGICAVTWPLTVAPVIDNAATRIVGEANSAMSSATGAAVDERQTIADRVGANLHRALIYETWANGMFGDASSPTAREFGPRLYAAMSLSRTEQAQIDKDPDKRDDLIDKHREQVDQVYDELRDKDPAAAEYLAGAHNNERFGYVLLGWFGFACIAAVAGIAALLLLVSLTAVRLVIATLPVFAIIGVLPSQQNKLKGLLDWTATCVVTAVVTGVISAVHTAAIGGFLSSSTQTDPLTTMVLMGAVTAATLGIIGAWTWKQHKDHKRRSFERDKRKSAADSADTGRPAGGGDSGGTARPAEGGFFTTSARGAARGAAGGAASTALLTVASGGALTAAAVTSGAARGAAVGAVGAHNPTAALAAGAVAARTAMPSEPSNVRQLPAAAVPADSPPGPAASTPTGRALPAAPVAPPVTEPAPDVFRPTDRSGPKPRLVEPTDDLVYPIFTGSEP